MAGRGRLPARPMVADPAARASSPRQLVLWGVAARGGRARSRPGFASGVYGTDAGLRARLAGLRPVPARLHQRRLARGRARRAECGGGHGHLGERHRLYRRAGARRRPLRARPAAAVPRHRRADARPGRLGRAAASGLRPPRREHARRDEADAALALCASCFRLSWICSYSRSISGRDRGAGLVERRARTRPSSPRSASIEPRRANRPARRTRSSRSAPVKRSLRAASTSRSTSLAERHPLGVDAENVPPPGLVGHRHVDQFVEAAGAEQGRIDQIRPVGRADHDHRLQFLEPVHLGEDGVDHALGDLRLAEAAAARGDEAVELVDEDHGRRDLAGAGEQAGDLLLALAIPFGEEVRAIWWR